MGLAPAGSRNYPSMSKPKRTSFQTLLGDEDKQNVAADVALSRDSLVTLPEPVSDSPPARGEKPVRLVSPAKEQGPRRRSPNDNARHSYHASLYLPEEAQFALREIALTMRRAKPHDVMLEAMAELFEKYNKGSVAKACRARITQRDKAVT